jgi:hypothetical protein
MEMGTYGIEEERGMSGMTFVQQVPGCRWSLPTCWSARLYRWGVLKFERTGIKGTSSWKPIWVREEAEGGEKEESLHVDCEDAIRTLGVLFSKGRQKLL